MRKRLVTCIVLGASCLVTSEAIASLMQFKDGQVHNVDYLINAEVAVDQGAPGIGTTLNLRTGGIIAYQLNGFEDSRIKVIGGSIGGDLCAFDRSDAEVSAGTITGYVRAYHSTNVLISGGWMCALSAYENSSVTFSGGTIGVYDLASAGHAQVMVTSGTINGNLRANGWSQIDLHGGSIGGNLTASLDAVLRIHGWGFEIIAFRKSNGRRISPKAPAVSRPE